MPRRTRWFSPALHRALLASAQRESLNETASRYTRAGRQRKHIYSNELPAPLGISAKEVPQHDVPEFGCHICPTASAIAAALGRSCWRQLFLPSNRASDELPNRASERLPGAPRRTRWCCQRTEMIERSYQNAQYTCFSSSSMHFWRTDTVVRTMLEHDRCAFSIVVQTTTKSPGYCTRQTIANSASPRCA